MPKERISRGYTEARKRANEKYMAANIWQIALKINRKLMPEVAEWLGSKDNVQEYIRGLIVADYEASIDAKG